MTNSPISNRARSLLLIVFFLALPAIASAQAGPPVGLTDIKVTSAMRLEYDVSAGMGRTGTISLQNTGDAAAVVSISKADMKFGANGEVELATVDQSEDSNADWIDIAAQVQIPVGASLAVPFTLQVPDDTDLHGSYWSLIVVKPTKPTSFDSESADAQVRTSVNVTYQYAVTVLTHVGAPEREAVQFEQPSFAPDEEGSFRLQVLLRNPGEFVLEAGTWLELYDANGVLVKRVEGSKKRLYPGTGTSQGFELGRLDKQAYQAVVIADAGGNSVFGVRYDLDTRTP